MKRLFAVSLCMASLVRFASAVGIPVNCSLFFNRSNAVQIAWNAYPGQSYVIQTTTNLTQPWQSGATLTTTSNSIHQSFPVTGVARFFKVVRLDTQGPEIYQTSPLNNAIGVDSQAVLQAWLRDETGVNTNSIRLGVGSNPPVTLSDRRLTYSTNGVLTYMPGTNEVLGALGQTVTVSLSAADTLGNQTTNFTWHFQLALPTVPSTNIVVLGGSRTNGVTKTNLTLISTNGNTFTYRYTGSSSGLSNGMQLVSTDRLAGYTCTVVGFTEITSNKTVVVVTQPTLLAELLEQGSLVSANFVEVTNGMVAKVLGQGGLKLNYDVPLDEVLYQNGNLLIETLPGSALNLSAELKLAANFKGFRLTAFQATLEGIASYELDLHALAQAGDASAGSIALITPIRRTFFGTIPGTLLPVWVKLVFEVNAGYTASVQAQAEAATGISASKQILFGKHWDQATGWTAILQNPAPGFSFRAPTWQIGGSADLRVYLQPKVTLLVYSTAGVTGDLEPYAELAYSFQLNPPQCDLGLYAGLDSDLALDLRAWDSKWGELPSATFKLVPQTQLWHTNCSLEAPEITLEPQDQTVAVGAEAVFMVKAKGSEPMSYQWMRGGLPLTDDWRITGSTHATLSIANVQTNDDGGYSVHVSNDSGSTNSTTAYLTVTTYSPPGGVTPVANMVWIPCGTFTMGSPASEPARYSDEGPQTQVTLSQGFWMGKYLVTQADYLAVVGSNPSYFTAATFNGFGTDLSRPVEQVSWNDAVAYCAQLTAREQAAGWVYRLPTEAEWEYACRAGTTTPFHYGNELRSGMANFDGQYEYPPCGGDTYYCYNPSGIFLARTTAVGSYAPNAWGLYDMHGNVREWCRDAYGAYSGGSVTDPTGPVSGSGRVFRGGGWIDDGWDCRSARRNVHYPSYWDYGLGFRVVLAPGQP